MPRVKIPAADVLSQYGEGFCGFHFHFMRSLYPLILLLAASALESSGEDVGAPRALAWESPCETLCANLIKAIQDRPDLMIMRLEDALVINEECAAEIVTAAMDAVRAKPLLVQKIFETAVKVAPSRTAIVKEAVYSYTPASERMVVMTVEEVRRAEVSESAPLFEVRRAEVASSIESQPIEEVRRAEVPALRAIESNAEGLSPSPGPAPLEEIRRAEMTVLRPSALSASR